MLFRKSKVEKETKDLLAFAEKVRRYREDVLSDSEQDELAKRVSSLREASSEDDRSLAYERLRNHLYNVGGSIFPKRGLVEIVELILVAAILAGGIRAFFIQPFRIPTNSMYPTYNGMTSEVYTGELRFAEKAFEKIFKNASFYEFKSPCDGEVLIPINQEKQRGSSGDTFEIYVGNNAVKLECPRDFSIDSVFLESFFPEYYNKKELSFRERWVNLLTDARNQGKILSMADHTHAIRTGVFIKTGETLLKFKIFGGDTVLVNRLVYNFFKPEVGEPFVFRTNNIPGLNNAELYYIKRLAGTPGDVLKISDKKLYRNGEPVKGSEIFEKNNNADHKDGYYGYLPEIGGRGIYAISLNKDYTVPPGGYYALGDNSSNSYDSRGWGLVPADDAIGRASFVIYPFSSRWGFAK